MFVAWLAAALGSVACKGDSAKPSGAVASAAAPAVAPTPAPAPAAAVAPTPASAPVPAPATVTTGTDGRLDLSSFGPTWQGLSVEAPPGATASGTATTVTITHGSTFGYNITFDLGLFFEPGREFRNVRGALANNFDFEFEHDGAWRDGFYTRRTLGDRDLHCVSAPGAFTADDLAAMKASCQSLAEK